VFNELIADGRYAIRQLRRVDSHNRDGRLIDANAGGRRIAAESPGQYPWLITATMSAAPRTSSRGAIARPIAGATPTPLRKSPDTRSAWTDLLIMVLREASAIAAIGAIIGAAAAVALSRYVRAMLFGITLGDPVTIGGAVVAMMAVALMAGWVPASKASRLDPMTALRHE
jgi:hypothetical protein